LRAQPPPKTPRADPNPASPLKRWVRVEKGSRFNAGAPDKYSADNWEAGGATVVTPKSGSAYVVWPVIHQSLTKRGLQSIKPEEVLAMQQAGKAVIVDCRPRGAWERERVAGSINVPLYRPVQGKTAWDTVKRAVMAVGLAMEATERNPDFVRDAAAALGPKRLFGGPKIILYCSLGGTLTVGVPPWAPGRNKSFKDDPERAFGRESRSLKACHELLEDGYRNVSHLRGGISVWRHDGFPIETGPPQ
jgi:rhodanese-related sulfurtransferase